MIFTREEFLKHKFEKGENYVYCLDYGDKVKIGRTINPKARVGAIENIIGLEFERLAFYKSGTKLESLAHKNFEEEKIKSEIFNSDFKEVCFFLQNNITPKDKVKGMKVENFNNILNQFHTLKLYISNKEKYVSIFNFLKEVDFFIFDKETTPDELVEDLGISFEEAVETIEENKTMTRYQYYMEYVFRSNFEFEEELFNIMLKNKEKEFLLFEKEFVNKFNDIKKIF